MPAARPVAERLWERVTRGDGCWEWTGPVSVQSRRLVGTGRGSSGYGAIKRDGRMCFVHRLSWELENGPIASDQCVLHRCDNRRCVRPDHLFLGTRLDNARDRDAKGRREPPRGEKNGFAKLTAEDVLAIRRRAAGGEAKRATGGEAKRAIARTTGYSQSHVKDIVNRRVWRHLP